MTPREALKLACARAGGKASLARKLQLKPSAVTNWFYRKRPPPAETVVRIEELTGVLRQELRPDLWPAEKRA